MRKEKYAGIERLTKKEKFKNNRNLKAIFRV